jgi:hypothetical protein
MTHNHFDLDTLITENYYSAERELSYDIFDELNYRLNTNRFSFSIPEDSPPTPPSTPRLTIHIPEEKDDLELESNPPTPKQPILDFSKEELLTSSTSNQIYKRPSKKSGDARKVWKYAKIPSIATIREIEMKLLDWAFTYASLEIIDKKIRLITWRSHSNCLCSSSWTAFLRWILCASTSS